MSNKRVATFVEEKVTDFLKENNMELYNIDFLKEGRNWVLRVYIDRLDGEYISTDDCEKVSRFLSEVLDEEELIETNYYLEISSPGMDRELKKEEHFQRYIGKSVDIKLYKAMDGRKEYTGELVGINKSLDGEEMITIKTEIDQKAKNRKPGAKKSPKSIETEERSFLRKDVAKVNLTVMF